MKRGGGGGSGVVRSTDGGYKLPSFSSDDTEPMDDDDNENDDDKDDENENEEEEEMDVEEDDEVDFPNLGSPKSAVSPKHPVEAESTSSC